MTNLLWAEAVLAAGLIAMLPSLLPHAWFRRRKRSDEPAPSPGTANEVNAHSRIPPEELDVSRREHSLTRLENRVLREFVSQADPAKSINLLLRHFIPDPTQAFAALIERSSSGTTCRFSRGLSQESLESLRLSDAELNVVQNARAVSLHGQAVLDSSVVAGLSRVDVAKARSLHLIAVGDAADPLGIFATTTLFPAGASAGRQTELAKRLMIGIASTIRTLRSLREREAQLRLTSEMLDLRSVADQRFNHPVALIEAFLGALAPKVEADSAALFLFSPDRGTAGPAIARCGGTEAAGVSGRWRSYEEMLARLAVAVDRPRAIGADELPRYGVDSLIHSALLLPLCNEERVVGLIVLARGSSRAFSSDDETLAAWSTEFLAKAIPRVLSQALVERQARQDGLTGLANRREWDSRFKTVLDDARRNGVEASVLLCDLDRFKAVNDTYGHRAGDEVLRILARTIQEQVFRTRSSDWALIARYGGEEIAVLLPGFGSIGAIRIAEAIRSTVERTPVTVDHHELRTTICIGLATFPDHAGTPEGLLSAADGALYHAKSTGRNRVCVADEIRRSESAIPIAGPETAPFQFSR